MQPRVTFKAPGDPPELVFAYPRYMLKRGGRGQPDLSKFVEPDSRSLEKGLVKKMLRCDWPIMAFAAALRLVQPLTPLSSLAPDPEAQRASFMPQDTGHSSP